MKKRTKPFPQHPIIGKEEKLAAMKVLNSGRLSYFQASHGKLFCGGENIKELERLFRNYHNTKYAIIFNSATAALHAAVVACDVKPLHEIVTTPYTFTSTATCAFMANAIPLFSDIKPDTFNIDPKGIAEKLIYPNSIQALIPVHIFGNPADMDEIMEIANTYDLKVIEDCAQAPGAKYKGKKVGTIGDCGVFSLTETKNITSGEGGVLITNNEHIADIAKLVRNHGEAIMENMKERSYNTSILGYNYRMTEIDAAIGIEQFKKLDKFNNIRRKLVNYLNKNLKDIEGITIPMVYKGNTSSNYTYALKYDNKKMSRDKLVDKLNNLGIPFGKGYIKPLYYSPIYHENKPWFVKDTYKYDRMCPVAEDCYFNKVMITLVARPPATISDMDDIINSIKYILE